ncbi:MAG: DUF4369 domain-containing protein [Lutibacter sp.]|nr:DUF4369 domain-containing protein [Lutibacter sp.]MBP9600194.1 DUF4369 domain-containing protein [Lutibacter sp.]
MKKLISCLIIVIAVISCSKEKTGNMIVKGTITDLKKGTVYLQKYIDTVLVSVDSVQLDGTGQFTLVDNVDSPEIYYVTLNDINTEKIYFFGDKGEINVTSKLEKFATSAKITGSKIHDKMMEHRKMISQFNNRQLELFKEKFDAQKANDTALLSKLLKEEKNLIKRKYYYTTNFAVTNADSEIAPFLALSELYNANFQLLDTVNNSLSEKVKTSKYGKELEKYILRIKDTTK